MKRAIDETTRRRAVQVAYNEENNITPQSIIKPLDMALVAIAEADYVTVPVEPESPEEELTPDQREQMLKELEEKMKEAARRFEFEKAAQIRDRLKAIKARIIHEQAASSGTSVLGAG
jgi:excinuclease ABC subunit B